MLRKKIVLTISLLGVLLTSCAATPLLVSFTMPTQDDGNACGVTPNPSLMGPIFDPGNTLTARIYWKRSTDTSVRDSMVITRSPGASVSGLVLAEDVGPGIWEIWVRATKVVSGRTYWSCISPTVRDTVTTKTREVLDLRTE